MHADGDAVAVPVDQPGDRDGNARHIRDGDAQRVLEQPHALIEPAGRNTHPIAVFRVRIGEVHPGNLERVFVERLTDLRFLRLGHDQRGDCSIHLAGGDGLKHERRIR